MCSMNKTAFLFPGQGAQYVQMGRDFHDKYSVSKQVYEEASESLGLNISKICFIGPDEDLFKTENTQPAILTTSIGILRALQQEGFSCDYTAGLSLGEYSALVNAEAIDFSDAVKLVRNRGIYMQQAVPLGIGGMLVIIGLDTGDISDVVKYSKTYGVLEIANYNTSEQIVLSGEIAAIKIARTKAKELGAKKAILLPVSAPFHCSLLKSAGEALKKDLQKIVFKLPNVSVINNADAQILTEKSQIISALVRQVSNSVLWQHTIELMLERGVKTFIEIGPGTTLSNFAKTIAVNIQIEVRVQSVEDLEGLKSAIELLE